MHPTRVVDGRPGRRVRAARREHSRGGAELRLLGEHGCRHDLEQVGAPLHVGRADDVVYTHRPAKKMTFSAAKVASRCSKRLAP